MTDRELLELAAKAAGLNIKGYRVDIDDNLTHVVVGKKGARENTNWNPLTDDGDALRLAVKLKLDVSGSLTLGNFRYICKDGATYAEMDKCPYYATRRAIVRAAAEIGRSMK
jgi:hypothetical protein